MKRHFASLGLLSPALIGLVACGPITSTARILEAQVEVDAAAGAAADNNATYEMTKAREYLHKAREEQGYSDYEVSVSLAEQATTFGEQAKTKAREHPSTPPPAPSNTVAPTPAGATPTNAAPIIVPPPPTVGPAVGPGT